MAPGPRTCINESAYHWRCGASFVRDIGVDPETETIVKAIITLGRSLGKSVTAEGVETHLQLSFLRNNACDEVQGFLFASPTPAWDVGRAVAAGSVLLTG